MEVNDAINKTYGIKIGLGDAMDILDKIKGKADQFIKEG